MFAGEFLGCNRELNGRLLNSKTVAAAQQILPSI
jgi:hypothetical protein